MLSPVDKQRFERVKDKAENFGDAIGKALWNSYKSTVSKVVLICACIIFGLIHLFFGVSGKEKI